MKIDTLQANKAYSAYKPAEAKPQTSQTVASQASDADPNPTDRVEIYAQASDVNEAYKLANSGITAADSDDRQARIASIKSQIEAGEYSIPSSTVAGSILGSVIDTRA